MRPESVTWVPSPDAYSSRNAVSLALAAVFLTAAKALGRRSAMRASFMVVRPARYAPRKRSSRARQHVENVPAAQSAKLASSYAQNSQRKGVAARRVCRSDGALQSMSFCTG